MANMLLIFLSYEILALNAINRNKTVMVRFNYTIKTRQI